MGGRAKENGIRFLEVALVHLVAKLHPGVAFLRVVGRVMQLEVVSSEVQQLALAMVTDLVALHWLLCWVLTYTQAPDHFASRRRNSGRQTFLSKIQFPL